MTTIDAGLRESVIALAADAGRAIIPWQSQHIEVMLKDDASPLTQADLAAHRLIATTLRRLTPDLPVLSEESAQIPWDKRRTWTTYWLVDPLDGTREFVKRSTAFCVCIALIDQGQPIFAVIQSPCDGITWHAVKGGNAYRRDGAHETLLRVVQPARAPLRVATSASHRCQQLDTLLARMAPITAQSFGSALKFCLISQGLIDVYPRFGPTSEWDTAAGQCLLESAGGALLSLKKGERLSYNQRPTLLNGAFIALGDPQLPWRTWLEPASNGSNQDAHDATRQG